MPEAVIDTVIHIPRLLAIKELRGHFVNALGLLSVDALVQVPAFGFTASPAVPLL